jgi:hypothetical protein
VDYCARIELISFVRLRATYGLFIERVVQRNLFAVDWSHWQEPDVRSGLKLKPNPWIAYQQKFGAFHKPVSIGRISDQYL